MGSECCPQKWYSTNIISLIYNYNKGSVYTLFEYALAKCPMIPYYRTLFITFI